MNVFLLILVFVGTTAIGYKVIKNVPGLLHTPLMSGMNALSGITIVAALAATSIAVTLDSKIIGVIAISFAMINVVGGFCVTDRMLKMFKSQSEVDGR